MCVFVHLGPMLSEWRCERPHIVCSNSVIGFSLGKQDGSSTYCRHKKHAEAYMLVLSLRTKKIIILITFKDQMLNINCLRAVKKSALMRSYSTLLFDKHWPVAGLQRTARWRCMWRDGLSPCSSIWWHSGVCQTLGGVALHAQQPQNTPAGFVSLLRYAHRIDPYVHNKGE